MDPHATNFGLAAHGVEELPTPADPNPLPRAVRRRGGHVLLDGEWAFALDPDDAGLREQWYLGRAYDRTATWPGSIEDHLLEARGETAGWHDTVVAWYERTFTLPKHAKGMLYQLTFGACGYETRVWLNGRLLKTIEGETVHLGEYTSFSYELRDEILGAENRLTVRIADSLDAEIPRGKQQSHVYKRGGIWYQTYTGAVRSVWVEPVERNRLRSRVGVGGGAEHGVVRFDLTTRVQDPGPYTLRLDVAERDGSAPFVTAEFPLRLEAGQRRQRVAVELPDARPWSPADPHLYVLSAALVDAAGHEARIETRFGLRTIEARGRRVLLNGEPVYLDGILYQPGTATYEEVERHLRGALALGCNLVRVHIAGVDPRVYTLADELGLLLWVEVPSPHSSTQRSRANHRAELDRMLALIGTHPSVVLWSLYNEDWGAQDIATNPETRRYVIETYHDLRRRYPQFLVVGNDGWQHVSEEGRLTSDLLTAHLYTPDLDRWKELLDRLVAGETEGVAAFPLVVGDPFFYRGQVPLVVSEWGGFGFPDYGGPADAEARAAQIRAFKAELRARPIAGDVYTQATNVEDERNGLIDAHTGALSVPEGLLRSRPLTTNGAA